MTAPDHNSKRRSKNLLRTRGHPYMSHGQRSLCWHHMFLFEKARDAKGADPRRSSYGQKCPDNNRNGVRLQTGMPVRLQSESAAETLTRENMRPQRELFAKSLAIQGAAQNGSKIITRFHRLEKNRLCHVRTTPTHDRAPGPLHGPRQRALNPLQMLKQQIVRFVTFSRASAFISRQVLHRAFA